MPQYRQTNAKNAIRRARIRKLKTLKNYYNKTECNSLTIFQLCIKDLSFVFSHKKYGTLHNNKSYPQIKRPSRFEKLLIAPRASDRSIIGPMEGSLRNSIQTEHNETSPVPQCSYGHYVRLFSYPKFLTSRDASTYTLQRQLRRPREAIPHNVTLYDAPQRNTTRWSDRYDHLVVLRCGGIILVGWSDLQDFSTIL